MGAEDDPDSDPPHQGRQRLQRRIEIKRRLKRMKEEADRSSLPAEDEEGNAASLEAGEQGDAAGREQEWEELQNELHEIRRADRARRTITPRLLDSDSGSERDEAVLDSPQESSPPHVSDRDSSSSNEGPDRQASCVENGPHSTDPEEVNDFDEHVEARPTENSDATLPGTRWITQQDLEGLIARGIDLLKSEVTDAVYYLNHLGEKVWVVDQNGDCVIAQDQNLD